MSVINPEEHQKMKAWIFSDLHLEMSNFDAEFKIPDADVCICAGNVLDRGLVPTVNWLGERIAPHMPVLLVPGNHEYHRASIIEGLEAGAARARSYPNLFILDRSRLTIGETSFIGATLWTDFNLGGNPRHSMLMAGEQLNDFHAIKLSKRPLRRFTPRQSLRLHFEAISAIEACLTDTEPRSTVIVTHYAPSLLSIDPTQVSDPLAASFASRLEGFIVKHAPKLWVHGHLHNRSDYMIQNTRIICNPRGFPGESQFANFDPALVIDLAPKGRGVNAASSVSAAA